MTFNTNDNALITAVPSFPSGYTRGLEILARMLFGVCQLAELV